MRKSCRSRKTRKNAPSLAIGGANFDQNVDEILISFQWCELPVTLLRAERPVDVELALLSLHALHLRDSSTRR